MKMNIDEITFYLRSGYSTDNRNQITFIQDIPSQGHIPRTEAILQDLKKFSKYMKKDENISLENKVLFGGWILIAAKAYEHDKITKKKNLPHQIKDWIYRECKTRKANYL